MAWTDERVEMLKKLHKDGLSASQIANGLGGVTRNAVIGKISRLGLGPIGGGRQATKCASNASQRARIPRPPRTVIAMSPGVAPDVSPHRVAEPVRVRYVEEGPGLATVHTLSAHMCKWPIGDPRDDGFTHCGKRRLDGPYCSEHAARAHQPAQPKKTAPAELARSLRRYL